jgi:putative SOS response-associated peptidase YedK
MLCIPSPKGEGFTDPRNGDSKAMPVILTDESQIETWLTAPANEALQLQRLLPSDVLKIVTRSKKEDGAAD